jgi:hypothetical protein
MVDNRGFLKEILPSALYVFPDFALHDSRHINDKKLTETTFGSTNIDIKTLIDTTLIGSNININILIDTTLRGSNTNINTRMGTTLIVSNININNITDIIDESTAFLTADSNIFKITLLGTL